MNFLGAVSLAAAGRFRVGTDFFSAVARVVSFASGPGPALPLDSASTLLFSFSAVTVSLDAAFAFALPLASFFVFGLALASLAFVAALFAFPAALALAFAFALGAAAGVDAGLLSAGRLSSAPACRGCITANLINHRATLPRTTMMCM